MPAGNGTGRPTGNIAVSQEKKRRREEERNTSGQTKAARFASQQP